MWTRRHSWIIINDSKAECQHCGRLRVKEYNGPHKLQRAYADSITDAYWGNFSYVAGECKKRRKM